MKAFILIGEHLSHSYSVPIHKAFFALRGVEAGYELRELAKEAFKSVRASLLPLFGANVTIPYKQAIIPYLDACAESALKIGAVNTIENANGRLIGHNTDIGGFIAMLEFHGLHVKGRPCAILGAGGAAEAAKAALYIMGAADVKIFSRTPDVKPDTYGYEGLLHYRGGLLVNCTPVGMYPKPDACPVSKAVIACFDEGADMIYNPGETVFSRSFSKSATGLYMLVKQAALAQEIWFKEPIKEELVDEVYHKMRKEF